MLSMFFLWHGTGPSLFPLFLCVSLLSIIKVERCFVHVSGQCAGVVGGCVLTFNPCHRFRACSFDDHTCLVSPHFSLAFCAYDDDDDTDGL
mmetsp:Transcript_82126/g.164112  ORF Transcript_82126/g.164112 Transcript_82126/m.164112 type:complete len:91 (+) Transcript_82126:62-334(+)